MVMSCLLKVMVALVEERWFGEIVGLGGEMGAWSGSAPSRGDADVPCVDDEFGCCIAAGAG
jgi:hypothetical protein